jgi:hypothetical protein
MSSRAPSSVSTELLVTIEYMERRRCRRRHFTDDEEFAAYQRRLADARRFEGERVLDYPTRIENWTAADLDRVIARVTAWLPLHLDPFARVDRYYAQPHVSVHRERRARSGRRTSQAPCFNALFVSRAGFLARVRFPGQLPVVALIEWLDARTFYLDLMEQYWPTDASTADEFGEVPGGAR